MNKHFWFYQDSNCDDDSDEENSDNSYRKVAPTDAHHPASNDSSGVGDVEEKDLVESRV